MRVSYLKIEEPICELDEKIEALRQMHDGSRLDIQEEILRLEKKSRVLTERIFKSLTPWDIVQLARHPRRPYTLDYIEKMCSGFIELHGDRAFSDDKAMVGGLAKLGPWPVMVIGQQKGRDTKEKVFRHLGMPHPEGYRKALRLMRLAERFGIPIVTLIDTPGAYCGVAAEARGQSEAIARNLFEMSKLSVPIVCVVIGEGCSGGALGIGVGDVVLMCQYAYYATISPEGCASILWKSADQAPEAADVMGITAQRLLELGLVDEVIAEPLGGAHRHPDAMARILKEALLKQLKRLMPQETPTLLESRYQRLMRYGRNAILR